MNVLLAEDDAHLAAFLRAGLEKEGYAVQLVSDGEKARDHVLTQGPDLLILDLGLPVLDGVEVLRATDGRVPGMSIVVLSGQAKVSLKIECLNLGADDYLVKPFSMHELLARCRAVRRRRPELTAAVLRHGTLLLNRLTREVMLQGHPLEFTTKEFALLEYLLLKRGRPVARQELLREVWRMAPDAGTNVVDVYINYVRRKLAAVDQTSIVETVRGEGYGIGVRAAVDGLPSASLHLPLFPQVGVA